MSSRRIPSPTVHLDEQDQGAFFMNHWFDEHVEQMVTHIQMVSGGMSHEECVDERGDYREKSAEGSGHDG